MALNALYCTCYSAGSVVERLHHEVFGFNTTWHHTKDFMKIVPEASMLSTFKAMPAFINLWNFVNIVFYTDMSVFLFLHLVKKRDGLPSGMSS